MNFRKRLRRSGVALWGVVSQLTAVLSPVWGQQPEFPFLPVVTPTAAVSPVRHPINIKGLALHAEDPFRLQAILETGDEPAVDPGRLKEEALKLIKYFLAGLTMPHDEMWVNLSPNEPDRVIPERFGHTLLGRNLLVQDYLLKQTVSALLYPKGEVGQRFWRRVYEEAFERYGTTQIPVDSHNRVWITPGTAAVSRVGDAVIVAQATMRVVLEEDYLAVDKGKAETQDDIGREVMRRIVLPALEHEVNEGERFEALRQMYNALVLAAWFKRHLKTHWLKAVYVDRGKIKGVERDGLLDEGAVYQAYLKAFRNGLYDLIEKEHDPLTDQIVLRRYCSGGVTAPAPNDVEEVSRDKAVPPVGETVAVEVRLDAFKKQHKEANASVKDVLRSLAEELGIEESGGRWAFMDAWTKAHGEQRDRLKKAGLDVVEIGVGGRRLPVLRVRKAGLPAHTGLGSNQWAIYGETDDQLAHEEGELRYWLNEGMNRLRHQGFEFDVFTDEGRSFREALVEWAADETFDRSERLERQRLLTAIIQEAHKAGLAAQIAYLKKNHPTNPSLPDLEKAQIEYTVPPPQQPFSRDELDLLIAGTGGGTASVRFVFMSGGTEKEVSSEEWEAWKRQSQKPVEALVRRLIQHGFLMRRTDADAIDALRKSVVFPPPGSGGQKFLSRSELVRQKMGERLLHDEVYILAADRNVSRWTITELARIIRLSIERRLIQKKIGYREEDLDRLEAFMTMIKGMRPHMQRSGRMKHLSYLYDGAKLDALIDLNRRLNPDQRKIWVDYLKQGALRKIKREYDVDLFVRDTDIPFITPYKAIQILDQTTGPDAQMIDQRAVDVLSEIVRLDAVLAVPLNPVLDDREQPHEFLRFLIQAPLESVTRQTMRERKMLWEAAVDTLKPFMRREGSPRVWVLDVGRIQDKTKVDRDTLVREVVLLFAAYAFTHRQEDTYDRLGLRIRFRQGEDPRAWWKRRILDEGFLIRDPSEEQYHFGWTKHDDLTGLILFDTRRFAEELYVRLDEELHRYFEKKEGAGLSEDHVDVDEILQDSLHAPLVAHLNKRMPDQFIRMLIHDLLVKKGYVSPRTSPFKGGILYESGIDPGSQKPPPDDDVWRLLSEWGFLPSERDVWRIKKADMKTKALKKMEEEIDRYFWDPKGGQYPYEAEWDEFVAHNMTRDTTGRLIMTIRQTGEHPLRSIQQALALYLINLARKGAEEVTGIEFDMRPLSSDPEMRQAMKDIYVYFIERFGDLRPEAEPLERVSRSLEHDAVVGEIPHKIVVTKQDAEEFLDRFRSRLEAVFTAREMTIDTLSRRLTTWLPEPGDDVDRHNLIFALLPPRMQQYDAAHQAQFPERRIKRVRTDVFTWRKTPQETTEPLTLSQHIQRTYKTKEDREQYWRRHAYLKEWNWVLASGALYEEPERNILVVDVGRLHNFLRAARPLHTLMFLFSLLELEQIVHVRDGVWFEYVELKLPPPMRETVLRFWQAYVGSAGIQTQHIKIDARQKEAGTERDEDVASSAHDDREGVILYERDILDSGDRKSVFMFNLKRVMADRLNRSMDLYDAYVGLSEKKNGKDTVPPGRRRVDEGERKTSTTYWIANMMSWVKDDAFLRSLAERVVHAVFLFRMQARPLDESWEFWRRPEYRDETDDDVFGAQREGSAVSGALERLKGRLRDGRVRLQPLHSDGRILGLIASLGLTLFDDPHRVFEGIYFVDLPRRVFERKGAFYIGGVHGSRIRPGLAWPVILPWFRFADPEKITWKSLGDLLHEVYERELMRLGLSEKKAHGLARAINQVIDDHETSVNQQDHKHRGRLLNELSRLNGLIGFLRHTKNGGLSSEDRRLLAAWALALIQERGRNDFFSPDIEVLTSWQARDVLSFADRLRRGRIPGEFLRAVVPQAVDAYRGMNDMQDTTAVDGTGMIERLLHLTAPGSTTRAILDDYASGVPAPAKPSSSPRPPGGVDFNPERIEWVNDVPAPDTDIHGSAGLLPETILDPSALDGITPVIIDIRPISWNLLVREGRLDVESDDAVDPPPLSQADTGERRILVLRDRPRSNALLPIGLVDNRAQPLL